METTTPPSTGEPPAPSVPAGDPTPAPPLERRRRLPGWRSRDVVRAAALVIALYLALRLLWFAQLLVLTIFLGVLFGLAVAAGVDRLERWRMPRGLAAALIVLGSVGLIVGFFAWSAPVLTAQSRELRTKLPEAIDKIDDWLDAHRGGIVGLFLDDDRPATTGATAASPTGAPTGPTGAAGSPEPALTDSLHARRDSLRAGATESSTLRSQVVSQLGGVKQYFFGFVSSTFATLGGVILVLVLAIYIATEPDTYHSGLMHLFPHYARRRAGVVLSAMAKALRKWLLTQLIAMLAIGTVTTIVLFVLGVRAAFPLGVLAGLFEFIPTIGPVLSAVPAVAMGFLDSPAKALWVGLAYLGIQLVENHLLIPVLMREGVDIPPALTIIAQALMALIFGFLGLLVAVPLLAAGLVAVKMLYVEDVVGDPVEVLDAGDEDDVG
jgi:predicted PurR-regulated permease PerM